MRKTEKKILEKKLSPNTICEEALFTGRFEIAVCTKTLYNLYRQVTAESQED